MNQQLAIKNAIEVKNLNFFYGKFQGLKNVSINIAERKVTAFIGPSGCGKSTLLRTLNRMYSLYPGQRAEGEINLYGQNILDKDQDLNLLRARVGMVFQKPNPFPAMSIRDNVLSGLRLAKLKIPDHEILVEECLVKAGLWNEVKDRLGAPALALSGGQQQRVALARAMARRPHLLLLDEPLSALDPFLRIRMREELKSLQTRLGISFVHVTHSQDEAMALADLVVVMNAGKIETTGPAREVFQRPSTAFAARFFGMNVLAGRMVGPVAGGRYVDVALNDRTTVRGVPGDWLDTTAGKPVLAAVRRESIQASREPMDDCHRGTIEAVSFLGVTEEYIVDIGGVSLRAVQQASGFRRGDAVHVKMSPDDWIVLP
mgnify:CR=1 FL=1